MAISKSAKFITKKTDAMLESFNEQNLKGELKLYHSILSKIIVCNDIYEHMINVYNDNNNNNLSNTNNNTTIYCESLVPECESFVPHIKKVISSLNGGCESLVPVQVLSEIPIEFVPIIKLLGGKYRVFRRNGTGRVYTNITNLARGYRKFLRLNGNPLIGFDIANSQPLIAAVLFKMYTEREYGCIKNDVQEYINACQLGLFYEYFMGLNRINTSCDDARTAFKKEFFGKVFYTKEVEKENYLKTQFKEKYPTCYEAIFHVKGGFYSEDYKQFPKLMTEIETYVMWEANIELIKQGYDVVNIFDSLYSDSDEAIAKAKEIVINKFADFGIKPKLKDISYRLAKPIQNSIGTLV